MKKVNTAAFILGVSMSFSTVPAFGAAGDFTDVSKDMWFYDGVQTAVSKGYVDGYPDKSFKPDQGITRAEFIAMLSRATKEVGTASGEWYAPYVSGLKAKKVLFDDDFSDYNAPMTRLELAKLSLRMVRKDMQNPDAVMRDESVMYNAVNLGLIQGLSGGELAPEQQTTRAQSITIIERVKKVAEGEQLPVDAFAKQLAEIATTGTNFKSVIGKEFASSLPREYPIAEGVKVKVNGIYLIDTDKLDESPFAWLLDGAQRGFDGKNFDKSYVMIYKVQWDLGEGGRSASFGAGDYFYMSGWDWVHKDNSLTYGIIRKEHIGTKDSYMIFARSKSVIKNFTPSYTVNKKEIPLFLPED